MYTQEYEEEKNMGILITVRKPDEKSVPQTGKREAREDPPSSQGMVPFLLKKTREKRTD